VNLIDGTIIDFEGICPELTIGRHPSNNIVISDSIISSKHLRIFKDESSFCALDTSANGTFVCGSRLTRNEMRRLKSGDEISLVQNSYKPTENAKHIYIFSETPSVPVTKESPITVRYDLGRSIGKGNFSEVKLGLCRLTGERVAVKIIDTQKTQ